MKKIMLRLEAMMLSMLMIISLFPIIPQLTASAYTPRTTAPAKDNKYYYSSINPFYPNYGLPNCTCYAYGRAYELLGYDPKLPTGNAENWYPKVAANKKGQTPKLGAIACWEGTGSTYPYGHVAVVEAINGSKITVSESNYGGELFKLRKDINPNTVFSSIDYVFQGYIYVLEDEPVHSYANIDAGTYYIKNNSTGTYLSVDSAIAADKQNVSVAAKSNSKAFQFKTTGGTEHYLYSMLDNNYVLNPYSDTPTSGTNVTLFKKVTDGTQIWGFEKANGGYYIRLKYNPNCVLAVNGSNVQLATYTGAANQIWTLEKADVVLSSIKINEGSFCSIYENGSTFKPDGLTLTATYSDGSTKNITSGYTVSEVDISEAGTANLAVTYGGKIASATITINDLFEGDGTDSSPYLVNTATDLENFAKMVNNPLANGCYGHASYKQTADIDLSEYSNWTPIGVYNVDATVRINDPKAIFRGVYNGNYHKITNLTVNTNGLNAGLFGRLNYTVDETTVIENLSVSGNITGQAFPNNEFAGGIAAVAGDGATIRNCDFTGTVNGTNHVGGIAGKLHNGGTIENCYVNAEINAATGYSGGICGMTSSGEYAVSYDATVKNCYFVGKLTGEKSIGGISGSNVKGDKSATNIIYTNNYYLNSAATGGVAGTAQAGCTGLISSQLKTVATDLGSPFAENTDDSLNNGYPVFEWQIETSDESVSGDVNNDGEIDLKDVVLIRRYIAGGWDVELDTETADVNNDGEVDLKDVVLIRRYIAGGWDVELA